MRPDVLFAVEPGIRRAGLTVSLAFVLVALFLTAIDIAPAGAVLLWLVCVLVMAVIWRCYLVPYIALRSDCVEVQGAFARRSVPYSAIRNVRPGLYGVRIETTDQGDVVAWAVQKSTFSEWLHRETRADVVVAEIMDRVRAASS